MRGTNYLMKNARSPAREPFPFVEILPLRLKPTVSGKSTKTSENICLQEINLLLTCLKKHDFNQSACNNEILAFQNCHKTALEKQWKQAKKEQKGEITVGTKNLTFKEINKVLKRYPPN